MANHNLNAPKAKAYFMFLWEGYIMPESTKKNIPAGDIILS